MPFHSAIIAAPQVATLSHGYTSTETGSPFIHCITPVINATVMSGRYVYRRSDPANDPPPRFIDRGKGYYITSLNTFSQRSYGVFYCDVTFQDGQRTVVQTIFVRSDGKYNYIYHLFPYFLFYFPKKERHISIIE